MSDHSSIAGLEAGLWWWLSASWPVAGDAGPRGMPGLTWFLEWMTRDKMATFMEVYVSIRLIDNLGVLDCKE